MNAWMVAAGLLCAASAIGCALARADMRGKEPRTESRMQPKASKMRVAAAQPRNRTIDWKISEPSEVLRRVDRSLEELEPIVRKAGAANCDAVAFPEDTLGLLAWEAAHPQQLKEVLPAAVSRMLDRLGRAAAEHRMYLVVCS